MSFPTINDEVTVVQTALKSYLAGSLEGYLALVDDDSFKAVIMPGVVPGGEHIDGKDAFAKFATTMSEVLEVKKFEPIAWKVTCILISTG